MTKLFVFGLALITIWPNTNRLLGTEANTKRIFGTALIVGYNAGIIIFNCIMNFVMKNLNY